MFSARRSTVSPVQFCNNTLFTLRKWQMAVAGFISQPLCEVEGGRVEGVGGGGGLACKQFMQNGN